MCGSVCAPSKSRRYTEECSGGDSDGWSVASFTSCGSNVVVVLDWKITAPHVQWKCGKWKECIKYMTYVCTGTNTNLHVHKLNTQVNKQRQTSVTRFLVCFLLRLVAFDIE